MQFRSFMFASAMLATGIAPALGETRAELAVPTLRANITVSGDIVRIGDVIENAGPAADVAIYRAPDLGTMGTLSSAQIVKTLRGHNVIGVNTLNMREVTITRLSRQIERRDLELLVAQAIERRNGLGEAADLTLTFDRDVQTLQIDAVVTGAPTPVIARFDSRTGRFDVTLAFSGEGSGAADRLRYTGIAIETVEATVLTRAVERNEVLKASDVTTERRPKAEIGPDSAARDVAIGMQARRQLRIGQALRSADLAKPDLVQRDQAVTLIYESAGLYLTIRGKATESGTEGDVVNVLNLQSKRMISGTVVGRGQVAVSAPMQRPSIAIAAAPVVAPAAAAVAESSHQRSPAKLSQNAAPLTVATAAPASVPAAAKAE